MRVAELATDLGVSPKELLSLLRTMRISATDKDASVSQGDVALILARLERERRSGHTDSAAAIEAAIVDAKPTAGKRRRRRKSELPPEPEPEAESEVDAAEEGTEAGEAEEGIEAGEVAEPAPDSEVLDAVDVGDEVAPKVDISADTEPAPAAPDGMGSRRSGTILGRSRSRSFWMMRLLGEN